MRLRKSRTFVFIAFCACTSPLETSTPENALRQFLGALSQGERGKAWEMLSSDTQTFLTHKMTLVFENASGLISDHPETRLAIVFMPKSTPPLLEKVELVEANEKTARLHVVASQKSSFLKMKKEAGQWKLAINHGVSDE